MKFFDIPYDPLTANVAPSLDLKTLRNFSSTSRQAREVFYPLVISYDIDNADQFQITINQLVFAIVHSDKIFARSELRKRSYEKLKQTRNQNQRFVAIRFLRYLLLLILNTHYHMGTPDEAQMHELRIINLIKYMNSTESQVYISLYYNKFNKNAELNELRVSIGKCTSLNDRLLVLYKMFILKQPAQILIQDIIDSSLHRVQSSVKPIHWTLCITDVPIQHPFKYDALLPFFLRKYSALDHMNLILKCIDLHEHTIQFLYPLYNLMIVRLVNLNFKIRKEDELIVLFKMTIFAILDRVDKILVSLTPNQQYSILFHIAGLSLARDVNEVVCQYVHHHLDYCCFENKEFLERLSGFNEKSKKSDLYCLFAFKKLFPKAVHVDTNFILDWRISKTSVLKLSSNEPLISLHHCELSSNQTIALYGRLKEQLKKHNKIREPYNPFESQYGRQNSGFLRYTNIEQESVFTILSVIYQNLDPNQCVEILSLIIDIAYGNKFKGLLERNECHLGPVLSHLCSKISSEEKLKLVFNIIPNIRNMNSTNPNCLLYLVDDHILKSIQGAKISYKEKLYLIDHIDLDKMSQETIVYFINKIIYLTKKIIRGESHLSASCEHYARWIWKLENYIPWNNNDIKKTIIKFLKIFILLFNGKVTNTLFGWVYEKYSTLERYFLILKRRINQDSYFRLLIEFLCSDKLPNESMDFVLRNIKTLFDQHGFIPEKWMDRLILLINSTNNAHIGIAAEIIIELLLNNLIKMDDLLFFQLKMGIEYLLKMTHKKQLRIKILTIAALYYPVTDLIDWVLLLAPEHKLSKKSIRDEILSIPLSFDHLIIFMNFHNQEIRHLAYYYLSMKKLLLSEPQRAVLFEHITKCIDMKITMSTSIISLLAYYQTPKHYLQTSAIVKRILYEDNVFSIIELIEHQSFCKLIRPLLEIFDETTKHTTFKLIIEHIESEVLNDNNKELHANLSELIPTELVSVESEYLPQGWINL